MRRLPFTIPLALLLIPVLLTVLHAQTGTLRGRVLDGEGKPLNRATVRVTNTTCGRYTEVDGTFLVANIPAGTHTVKISYGEKQEHVQASVPIAAGQTFDLGSIRLMNTGGTVVAGVGQPRTQSPSGSEVLRTSRGRQNAISSAASGASICTTQGTVAVRGVCTNDLSLYMDDAEQSDHFTPGCGNRTPSILGLEEVQTIDSGSDTEYASGFDGGVELSTSSDLENLLPLHNGASTIQQSTPSAHPYPFTDPLYQTLSTFSIDAGGASYALTRNALSMGTLPPPEVVRIEEMINRFRYDYPQPEGSHPFSISLDAAECPWRRGAQLVRVGIQGRNVALSQLPPANLVFLIDVSGSMQRVDKLPLLKRALGRMVEQLRPQDRVAIVTCAGSAGLLLPSTTGDRKTEIIAALDRLDARGSTNAAEGLRLAYKVARENAVERSNNRVIFATDGDFNAGIVDNTQLVRTIETERRADIFLTTLGVGTTSRYQDARMKALANRGDGNYAFLDSDAEAERFLVGQIAGTLFTIAKDVKVQVEFDPRRVAAYRLIGYDNRTRADQDFDNDRRDAGELGADHAITALYEIVPIGAERSVEQLRINDTLEIPRTFLPSEAIVRVRLRYKNPTDSVSQLVEAAVPNRFVRIDAASADFRFAAAVAAFGMMLRGSQRRGTAETTMVLRLAGYASGQQLNEERAEFVNLVKQVETSDLLGGGR